MTFEPLSSLDNVASVWQGTCMLARTRRSTTKRACGTSCAMRGAARELPRYVSVASSRTLARGGAVGLDAEPLAVYLQRRSVREGRGWRSKKASPGDEVEARLRARSNSMLSVLASRAGANTEN
jgi:hypothetical protein